MSRVAAGLLVALLLAMSIPPLVTHVRADAALALPSGTARAVPSCLSTVEVLADRHDIPFFIAAPLSTVDLKCPTGDDIPIEDRKQLYEITHVLGTQIVPDNTKVIYPAFDVTPNSLIQALFTEAGVAEPPSVETIAALFSKG